MLFIQFHNNFVKACSNTKVKVQKSNQFPPYYYKVIPVTATSGRISFKNILIYPNHCCATLHYKSYLTKWTNRFHKKCIQNWQCYIATISCMHTCSRYHWELSWRGIMLTFLYTDLFLVRNYTTVQLLPSMK